MYPASFDLPSLWTGVWSVRFEIQEVLNSLRCELWGISTEVHVIFHSYCYFQLLYVLVLHCKSSSY